METYNKTILLLINGIVMKCDIIHDFGESILIGYYQKGFYHSRIYTKNEDGRSIKM